jgi:hypothetical protein
MNVPTLTMPVDLAREKYEQYKAALDGSEPKPEDANILLGYKALAQGKQLCDLHEVFRTCPLDDKKLPRFAIARASWEWCHFNMDSSFAIFAGRAEHRWTRRGKRPHGHLRIPLGTMPRGIVAERYPQAIVPIIPAPIRPKGNLSRYTILFEAEWKAVAPTDPLLLSKLTGSLYVILAAWDLTELERAVLAGRLVEGQG